MKGTYQHRICFFYFDLFTLEDDGVWINKIFYPWCDLERLVGSNETEFLVFKNKKKMIKTRRFRKKGEPLTLTFFGKNKTYEDFSSFISHKIYENEMGQEYKELLILRDKLEEQIKEAPCGRIVGNSWVCQMNCVTSQFQRAVRL